MDATSEALTKTNKIAKQKFRTTRLSCFSRVKAYIVYVKVLKNSYNTVGRTFCDAITSDFILLLDPELYSIAEY